MNEGDTDSTVLTIRPIKGNPNRRKELSKHFEKGGGIEFFKNNLETIVINGRTFIKFPYWIEQSRDMLDDMEAHHESNLPEGIQQLLDKHGRFAFDDFQQNNPNMIMSTDRIKENVFNSQNSADKDLLLIKAAHALQKYLGAGTKEKRKEASETAKLVYKQITGKEYENE